jgi:hypothetical protein
MLNPWRSSAPIRPQHLPFLILLFCRPAFLNPVPSGTGSTSGFSLAFHFSHLNDYGYWGEINLKTFRSRTRPGASRAAGFAHTCPVFQSAGFARLLLQ